MISHNDIQWIADEKSNDSNNRQSQRASKTSLDMPSKNRKNKVRAPKQSKQQSNEKAKNVTQLSNAEQPSSHISTSSKVVTLKDLSEEDKQKIAQLIKELAKVGEEKESVVSMLKNERREFVMQIQKMEEEKVSLLGKRDLLMEEVKQCQHLLQYYQNLIAMQQNSIQAHNKAKDIEKVSKNKLNDISHDSLSSRTSTEDCDTDDIKVQDFHEEDRITDTDAINQSEDDFSQMSSRQYKDFLWQKKEKLQREQENLRKLLIASEESFAENDGPLRLSDNLRLSNHKGHADMSLTPSKLNVSKEKIKQKSTSPTLAPLNVSKEKSPSRTCSLLPAMSVQSSMGELAEEVLFAQDFDGMNLENPVCHVPESNGEQYQDCQPTMNPYDDSQILEDIFFVL